MLLLYPLFFLYASSSLTCVADFHYRCREFCPPILSPAIRSCLTPSGFFFFFLHPLCFSRPFGRPGVVVLSCPTRFFCSGCVVCGVSSPPFSVLGCPGPENCGSPKMARPRSIFPRDMSLKKACYFSFLPPVDFFSFIQPWDTPACPIFELPITYVIDEAQPPNCGGEPFYFFPGVRSTWSLPF